MGSAPSRSESVPSLGTPKKLLNINNDQFKQQSKSLPPLSTCKSSQEGQKSQCVKSQNSENGSLVISPFTGDFKLDHVQQDNSITIQNDSIKISVLGTQTSVGKSTLIRNFVEQEITFQDHNPTIGIEFYSKKFFVSPTKYVKFNIFELQNSDQVWQKMPKSDIIFLIFDDFQKGNDRILRNKIKLLNQCIKERQKIILVGNDKLDMKITGLETILKSDFVKQVEKVNIINFNYLKEVNDLFIQAYETNLNSKQKLNQQNIINDSNSITQYTRGKNTKS